MLESIKADTSENAGDYEVRNVLAERYASPCMKEIWSPRSRVLMEREFWIAVLKAQKELGVQVEPGAIEAYERVKADIDLKSIEDRERQLLHDVKSRIEEFNELAGYEEIHKGLTSRDLTENIEQLQILRSLEHIRIKAIAALLQLSKRADQYKQFVITGRTHNSPAQATTLGKRIVMIGEELLHGLERLDHLINHFSVRGIKGAVGTQLDLLTLFSDDTSKVAALERKILEYLGVTKMCHAVGQIYPRSYDFEVISVLYLLSCPASNFATTLRLMAGHELASEGFGASQVGSSAMPHKMNCRTSERINGINNLLQGYVAASASVAGGQWNEGDVSCSVVRRVFLPDTFFAIDGLFEAFLTVVDQLQIFAARINHEKDEVMPFLVTSTILMEAVKSGAGRETAHNAIREHAISVKNELRTGKIEKNDLLQRLAGDDRIHLTREQLEFILSNGGRLTGSAGAQVDWFVRQSLGWASRFPQATQMRPGKLL